MFFTRTLLFLLCAILPIRAAAEVPQRTANDGNVILEAVPEIPAELGERLNRYQNVRSASFQDWDDEGKGLYITTRFGEVNQLHHVRDPGGARRQLTFYPEPVASVDRQPQAASLSFVMDEGGNENYQIFLLQPDSGVSRRLTDGTSRNGTALWSPSGKQLAFRSTRRNGRSNDIWVLDPSAPDSAKIALESPDGSWWGPMDWSADEAHLLAMQYVSITDSRIHLVNLSTGNVRRVAGSEEKPVSFGGIAPTFDQKGQQAFVATDANGDFKQLARLDLQSGRLQTITREIPWDIEDFVLSEDRSRGAFAVNEGGIDRLYLFDPQTDEYRVVDRIPIGLIGDFDFSPDGKRLALTLNSAQSPSDVYTLELGETPTQATGLTRWTYSEVGGLNTEKFSIPELIHYPTFDQEGGKPREIPAFVYKPSGTGPYPVVVYIHGGPESQFRPAFRAAFQSLIDELGVAVIAPNVRGSAGYGRQYVKLDNGFLREDSVKDIGALLDWIATQPDLDASRVGVYGGSYGGYMVLSTLMHYGDRLKAGVDIVGISNFVTFLENTKDYRRDLRRAEYGDERDPEMREHLQRISPSNNAQKLTTPLFVAQGQNDPRVPVTEAQQIVREVRAQGYDVWYMNCLNEGHGFKKKENRDLYSEIVLLFLEKHLLNTGAAESASLESS